MKYKIIKLQNNPKIKSYNRTTIKLGVYKKVMLLINDLIDK